MKYIILLLLLFLTSNRIQPIKSKFQGIDLTIKAFYSDYQLKYDQNVDSTYTGHRTIQVRMTEKIPNKLLSDTTVMSLKKTHYITNTAGLLIFPWIEIREKEIGSLQIELPQLTNSPYRKASEDKHHTLLRYSYLSPSNVMEGVNPAYPCPQFYAMTDFQSYIFTRKGETDTLRITFDIPESLFYLRSDMPIAENKYDPDYKFILTTTDKVPSFFLYYKPAFLHDIFQAGEKMRIDLLWENIDTQKSSLTNIELKPLTEKEEIDTAKMIIKRIIEKIELLTGNLSNIPNERLEIVITKQVMDDPLSNTNDSWTWARTYHKQNHQLIIMDKSNFHTSMPAHEILHLYFPFPDNVKSSYTSYEKYIISEALIEYSASVLNSIITSKNEFKKKIKIIQENNYDKKAAQKAALLEENAAFSNKGSSSWLYYEYIPFLLHKAAQKSKGDKAMLKKIIQFLVKGTNCNWDKNIINKDLNEIKTIIGI